MSRLPNSFPPIEEAEPIESRRAIAHELANLVQVVAGNIELVAARNDDPQLARYISNGIRGHGQPRAEFTVAPDPDRHGRMILTDQDEASLAYTVRATDPSNSRSV